MQRILYPHKGGLDVFRFEEVDDLQPGPGEVRIAVEASGINFADLMARMGNYPDAPPFPFVVGYEVAGTIDAVGEGVDPARIGQAVLGMCRFGGYASQVVLPALQAVPRPEGMDAVTGAAVPVVYLTAWMMTEVFGRVREGDRVLVHSAGGGVGLAALDLLRWRGAVAIGTASASKHEFLRERGYDELVDYRSKDFAQELEGRGLDLILDPLGGETWAKGLGLLRAGGRLVCFGFAAGSPGKTGSMLAQVKTAWQVPWLKVNPIWLMNHNVGVMSVNMGHMWDEGERVVGWLGEVVALWEKGVVRPKVHAAVPWREVAEGHRMLHDRENLGKVILTWGE